MAQYFWPENFRINEVVMTLQARGFEVEVLTGKPNYPEGRVYPEYKVWGFQYEVFHGTKLFRVPLIPRGKQSRVRLAANYLSFIIFGSLFGPWLLRGRSYDVILVHGMSPILQAIPAIVLGWLKRAPVIVWVQDLWPESLSATGYVKNQMMLGLVKQAVSFIYRHSDLLLVQSKAFIEPVSKLAPDTPISYYPNSVDDSFAVATTEEPPLVPGLAEGFSVMFAGNIGAAQAVGVIVEAAALLKWYPDIHFVVLGEGSSREWMRKEAALLELTNLHLPGRFPLETMPAFMQRASALLVTLSNKPIFAATVPNKVQAYLAAGRPVIACLNGEGARLVIEAGAGFACPAEDAAALADTILRLYRLSPAERLEMGKKGRRYFKLHFDHSELIDQLIEILRKESARRKGKS